MHSDVFYKKLIVVLVAVFAATITASVLATYFAKRPKNDDNIKFLEYICQNLVYIKEIGDYCKSTTTPAEIDQYQQGPIYQLPNNLAPTAYDLNYNFFSSSSTDEPDYFKCDETVYFTCLQPTDTIVMHMKDLYVDNSSFVLTLLNDSNSYLANQIRFTATWSYDSDKQFMSIKFGQYVLARNTSYAIRLAFEGKFRNDGSGLFKSPYTNSQKITRWIVALEAQPASARKAFVSFDEPQYKAKYKIFVTHSSGLSVWSNMPTRQIDNANISALRMRTEFQQTPVISTYLLGLVMSDFKCSQARASIGVTNLTNISVCAAPDSIEKVSYSLGLSKSLFEFFQTFYDFQYFIPKSDLLALPQHSCHGKSNLGLIEMKDEIVFNDAKTFSQASLQRNLIELSKQISQQWLGNLVSLKWWDDYWLFESLNYYLSYIASNNINSGINILEQLVIKMMSVINDDAFSPVTIDTQLANLSFSEYLDEQTVNKATYLIRMVNYILGNERFSSGTKNFLKNFAYSNAKQIDYWNNFNNVSSMNGANLSTIMFSWTRQSGHPIVTVKRINSTHILVSQAPFVMDSTMSKSQKWFIPFSYVVVDNITVKNNDLFNVTISNFYLKIVPLTPDMNETLIFQPKPLLINESYVIANLDVSGFYRVNYDEQNWDLIIQQLINSKQNIPTRNRAQLINDLFAFAQMNLVDPLKPFSLIGYMVAEDDYLPWQAAIRQINGLKDLIDSSPIFGSFRNYLIKLVTPIYSKLNWNESLLDSWLDKLLRTSILEFACDLEIQDCIQKSLSMFKAWTLDSTANSLPIQFQKFIYCKGIEYGTIEDWKYMFNRFTLELDPSLKENLLYGLACSRDPWLIQTYLDNQISPDFFVSNQTIINAVKYAASRSSSYMITWQFVKKNWDRIQSSYGGNLASRDLLTIVTRKFSTQDLLDDFNKFFQDKQRQKQQQMRELERARNQITLNLKWLKNVYDPLSKWLTKQ